MHERGECHDQKDIQHSWGKCPRIIINKTYPGKVTELQDMERHI